MPSPLQPSPDTGQDPAGWYRSLAGAHCIQITNIDEKDDTAPGTSALAIDRGHGQLDPVSKGSRIQASDLDKLVWRSDANSGGSFTFSMIGADGKSILTTNPANPGSTPTLTRTITIDEGVQGRPMLRMPQRCTLASSRYWRSARIT